VNKDKSRIFANKDVQDWKYNNLHIGNYLRATIEGADAIWLLGKLHDRKSNVKGLWSLHLDASIARVFAKQPGCSLHAFATNSLGLAGKARFENLSETAHMVRIVVSKTVY